MVKDFAVTAPAPEPLQKTSLGVGGVQSLDGAPHRHRKAMFLSLMTPERIGELAEIFHGQLLRAAAQWRRLEHVQLYDALQPVLTSAVCRWSGIPLRQHDLGRRARQLTAMFDAAGRVGLAHIQARLARKRAERWCAHLIKAPSPDPGPETALHVIALHRDANDRLLRPRIAAVELLNVLRPTVAVPVYIVICAHAPHQYPAAFPAGRRVLLDLHGINHDPRLWQDPGTFHPARFLN
jgi:fatty-acid peroxygenase